MVYDTQHKESTLVKMQMMEQRDEQAIALIHKLPVITRMTFHMPIPKSLSQKKQKELIGKPHIKKPDRDNLEKFYMDCANGVIWADDALNYRSELVEKIYSDNPRTEMEIYHCLTHYQQEVSNEI
jgi:Holliday junction resolvase RusA-like endonuclease